MVNTVNKKLDTLVSISIILIAILLSIVLVKNYIFNSKHQAGEGTTAESRIKIGTTVSLPDINWKENSFTLLLVISSTCHFCSESAPFYQRLVKELGGSPRIVALLPQPVREGEGYLNILGIPIDKILQVRLGSLGVEGTPTLILVGENGIVRNMWVGKLPSDEETKVISQIRQNIARKQE